MTTLSAPEDGPERGGFQLDEIGPANYDAWLVPRFFAPLADRLLESTPPRSGEHALDLACGTGVVTRRVADLAGPAGRVIGVDVNSAMIDFAGSREVGERSTVERSPIEWLVGDSGYLPVPAAWADTCYCQQGWQFFTDQRKSAQELARVCRPGARVALTIWRAIEHNPVFSLLVDTLDREIGHGAAATMRAPFAGPTKSALREQLTAAGFDRVAVRILSLEVRFPSVSVFLRQEAAGSPLGTALQRETEDVLVALTRSLDQSLDPYIDDDGLVLPMQTWLVTARRAV